MVKKKPSTRLREAILETAHDMHRLGLLDADAHQKITVRQLGKPVINATEPMTGEEIKMLRQQAHLSQAVFAHYLNLTGGYISQLERGIKQASGAALALLNVIRRKGIEAIL